MIRITYRGEDASITVGRDSPSFVYGGRDLPEDIQGFPAFILDTRGLGVDGSGLVYRDDSVNYQFGGGTDGRDLITRPVSPIGELAYTPATIKVADEEIENPDGSKTKTRSTDFDLAGTMRRMTGETALEIELGPESLGNLIPGSDFAIGDKVFLSIWGRDIEVIVSGYSYGQTGWTATVQTEDQLRDFEAQKRRLSSTTFWEELEDIHEELRGIQDDSAYGEGGGLGAGVIRVQKESDGRLIVVYSEGPDDVWEADVSDVSIDGNELVIKKGENEFKRIPLPSGGGGIGNGNLSDVYLDLLRRSDAAYSSFGVDDYIDDLPVGEPRPEEEDKVELTERLPHFYEVGGNYNDGTWRLRDPRDRYSSTNMGVMLIRAFRGSREESELFLVRVISIKDPGSVTGEERHSRLALTDSSRISISGNARINPSSNDSVFTTGIFHREFRVAFGDPDNGTPPSEVGGSSQTRLEWVFLPNAATRYKQQLAGGMDDPFLQGEKTVVSVRSDNPGFLTVKYSDSDEQTFEVGGGGSGGPGVESVSVQSGYLMVRMEGNPQPQIYPLFSSYDIDPVTMRRRGATDFVPYNENSEFVDYTRLSEGIISVDVSVFGLDHGNLYVKVMGDAIEPSDDDFYREFIIPVTHGTESQGFLEDRTYVRIPPDRPVRSIGGKGAAILSLDGFNQVTGEHSTGFEMMMGELNPAVFENIRVYVSYRHNTRVYKT